MSAAYDRGRDTEREVAALLRRKLGARVQRDPRSGAGVHKADIRDHYQEIPLSIECKDQQTLKVKEWMRQAIEAASFTQIPTLVFRADEELLACVRFSDLTDLLLEIADARAELADLRRPVDATSLTIHHDTKISQKTQDALVDLGKAVDKQIADGAKACPNGHIVDDTAHCLWRGCQYSHGYRAPKNKAKVKQKG